MRMMMKRRYSTASNYAKRRTNGSDCSGLPLSDLPEGILVKILLRLAIKRIFVCKCVCKTWYDLISDPYFAKLHFNQSQVYPLLRTSGSTLLLRMLYLVQPELYDFRHNPDVTRYKRYTDSSPMKIKLDSKLKLPLRNLEANALDKERVEISTDKNCIKLNMKYHKYNIVNSCNGLLCLSNHDNPVIVCNPVTGEFINPPKVITTVNDHPKSNSCGFGFSPMTNQYKVIRMFSRWIEHEEVMMAQVHILGTETWKDLGVCPTPKYLFFPTYLYGLVYWLPKVQPRSVISFDIEKECFESISVPPLELFKLPVGMGVLGRELFIIKDCGFTIDFWAMKDNKSWSQIFSFPVNDDEKWPYGSYQPIAYLNNGALLIFHHSKLPALICKDPKKNGFGYFEVRGFNSDVEAILHIPSFIPLKHALSGHNVKVLNFKSRCGKLKLHGEGQCISLVEKDMDFLNS